MDTQAHSHIGTSNTSKILLQQRQIVPHTLRVRMRIQQTNRAAILHDDDNNNNNNNTTELKAPLNVQLRTFSEVTLCLNTK